METGGFDHDPLNSNPGVWLSPDGVQIDLILPAAIAGRGRRSVDSPPHGQRSMRKSYGLEAALVSNKSMKIVAFDSSDIREFHAMVAGPAALLVAKLHKLHEQTNERHAAEVGVGTQHSFRSQSLCSRTISPQRLVHCPARRRGRTPDVLTPPTFCPHLRQITVIHGDDSDRSTRVKSAN